MSRYHPNKKLVHGVGTNDADYVIQKTETLPDLLPNGKNKTKVVWYCPEEDNCPCKDNSKEDK